MLSPLQRWPPRPGLRGSLTPAYSPPSPPYSDGPLGLGYTAPELRRHGLASINMEQVINRINGAGGQQENFGFVVTHNKASANMISALGFAAIGLVSWLTLSPVAQPGSALSRL